MVSKDIKLGKGLDKLKFGMTREEVKAAIGEPNEVENYNPLEEDEGESEAWHYDELELSASFDEEDDFKLTSLAVSSSDYLFEGVNLIGLSQEEVMQQVELMDLGDVELETVAEDDTMQQSVGSIPEASLNLWFEDGQLSEIQWGPFWDEDEECYIWPD
ncbi:hypothetical protein [Geofilum rubicundum]|uniref:Uncharacterized protein n=1 Tax=Geofilum rubicundum JCM 15548 TaxID=1236989 RepID=A0A0E9LZ97_9BACT|nr:hypothetical protein [Geofilum rubicundum]GAO30574.1 hypothetical protein JCM15548_12860 [Geofilum rubicundum JCM 15548]